MKSSSTSASVAASPARRRRLWLDEGRTGSGPTTGERVVCEPASTSCFSKTARMSRRSSSWSSRPPPSPRRIRLRVRRSLENGAPTPTWRAHALASFMFSYEPTPCHGGVASHIVDGIASVGSSMSSGDLVMMLSLHDTRSMWSRVVNRQSPLS